MSTVTQFSGEPLSMEERERYQSFSAAPADGPQGGFDYRGHAPSAFELVPFGDLEFRPPEFLIDGLLEADVLAQVFGEPGAGKSFVALDMAFCVATGRDFHGRKVKQGAVIYLAGEGHNGLARRRAAWEKHRGCSLQGAPVLVSKVAAQMLDQASAAAVGRAVEEAAKRVGDVALIVVDTLARNFGPGDENATADMTRFVSAIDDLRAQYGATALIVHHSGHSDKSRARGSTVLFGALDAAYRIDQGDGAVTVSSSKMKDASPPDPMSFSLKDIELGSDEAGRPITSAVLVQCVRKGPAGDRLTPVQKMALQSFHIVQQRSGDLDRGAGVHLEDWRPEFYAAHTGDTTDAKQKAFQRVRKSLVETGHLRVESDVYFPNIIREAPDGHGHVPDMSRTDRTCV